MCAGFSQTYSGRPEYWRPDILIKLKFCSGKTECVLNFALAECARGDPRGRLLEVQLVLQLIEGFLALVLELLFLAVDGLVFGGFDLFAGAVDFVLFRLDDAVDLGFVFVELGHEQSFFRADLIVHVGLEFCAGFGDFRFQLFLERVRQVLAEG